jgi:hypothetical protein
MNITFDIKCVKHFQVGVCPDEDNAGGAGSACTAPSAAAGFSFNPATSVPGLSVTTNFSQICNEITMSFNGSAFAAVFTSPVIIGTITPFASISTLVPFYTGAFYVDGFPIIQPPFTKRGVGSINLNSTTGNLTLYVDNFFTIGLDINSPATFVGSIIFYVL